MHSPEPWASTGLVFDQTLVRPKRGKPIEHKGLFDANGELIGDAIIGVDYSDNSSPMSDADIDRIVACVNALAGIPTSLLTTGTRCQIAAALANLDLGSLPDKVMAALQTDTEVPRAQH